MISAFSDRRSAKSIVRRRIRLVGLACLVLVGSGCAKLGEFITPIQLPDAPRTVEVSPAATREHNRILAAYGGSYEDARLEAQILQIVERLVAASERPDLRYRVTILNSSAVNAFALPNGQLYVTRGLIALANDSSELASVLAHEMSHVVARHAAIRESQVRQAALVNRVVSDVLTDPQVGALALARSKIALASFSRAQEFEADGIGVGIAARAGYDPYGAVRFLTSMGRNAELKPRNHDRNALEFLSSHPATPERVRNAQRYARQHAAPGAGDAERAAYLSSIDGLVYGEDPSEGFVRGRRFLHPKLGFTFTAPDGFTLENTAQAVLGTTENGSQAFRLDVVRIPPEQSLAAYLQSGWIENVDTGSIDELPINGFPAATATAHSDQWNFRLYVIRFGSDVYRFIFAAKQRSPAKDLAFRYAINTFRRMSLAEIQAAKPLRLQIATVQRGDTVEKLAARMAASDRPVERFRTLNGLEPGERPKVGDQVKIVTE